ncbi:uncharacterized protein LOC134701226 [Mytilus trossulus]|uniref:uncharacterized protein LOC134701226 n=1 Tax=Mytilus trossulus TaxID=6551 RepID=UPI003006E631
MNIYSSILKLLYTSVFKLLMICVFYSLGQQSFSTDRRIFVGRNETVILNCTCFNKNESSWRVLKYPRVTAREIDAIDEPYIPYTEGLLLNPKLMNSNIDIVGDYKSGECNLIIRNFSNHDEGTYKCEYWKNGNIYIDTYHVQIRNPVVMEVTYTNFENQLTIDCKAKGGEPDNYTVNLWEHRSEFNEYIRSFEGGKLTFSELNSKDNSYENDGIYTCQATNGMIGAKRRLAQKGSILINNKVPPIFVSSNNEVQDGRYGQKINLTVILYNKFGRIQTYISKLNESLNISANQQLILTHELSHNVNITVSGIKVTFQMILDKDDDFTNYTIKACNEEGCNEFIVEIILSGHKKSECNNDWKCKTCGTNGHISKDCTAEFDKNSQADSDVSSEESDEASESESEKGEEIVLLQSTENLLDITHTEDISKNAELPTDTNNTNVPDQNPSELKSDETDQQHPEQCMKKKKKKKKTSKSPATTYGPLDKYLGTTMTTPQQKSSKRSATTPTDKLHDREIGSSKPRTSDHNT